MEHLSRLVIKLLIICSLVSCRGKDKSTFSALPSATNEYARFFTLSRSDSSSEVTIISPVSGKTIFRENFSGSNTPSRVVCMSTGHVAYMAALGVTGSIAAISGSEYLFDKSVKEMVDRGEIMDIGYEGSLNYELLIKIDPDIIFTYGIEGENNTYIEKLRKLGFRVVVLGDYLENHPLGKLEYIKLFGAIFNCQERADSIYIASRDRYLELTSKLASVRHRPKVLLNAPWKEIWYIPGEENYMSVMIRDAGGRVLLSRSGESASHPYSIEDVFKEALEADIWLNPNNWGSVDELMRVNPLFRSLPVLKQGLAFNNNNRSTPSGGSDFWERGVTEPDVILEDLISILHPEILKKEELKYYKKL